MSSATLTPTTLPDWMTVHATSDDPPLPKFPRTRDERQLEQSIFEAIFETVLDFAIEGKSIKRLINSDPRNVTYGRFMQWLKRDQERFAQYEEAREIGAEAVMEEMKEIADAENSLEDVQRSQLRVNVRKIELQAWNRKRYGDKQQIEQSVTIDLTGAIAKAQARLENYKSERVIEGEVVNG